MKKKRSNKFANRKSLDVCYTHKVQTFGEWFQDLGGAGEFSAYFWTTLQIVNIFFSKFYESSNDLHHVSMKLIKFNELPSNLQSETCCLKILANVASSTPVLWNSATVAFKNICSWSDAHLKPKQITKYHKRLFICDMWNFTLKFIS